MILDYFALYLCWWILYLFACIAALQTYDSRLSSYLHGAMMVDFLALEGFYRPMMLSNLSIHLHTFLRPMILATLSC